MKNLTKKQKATLIRIIITFVLFAGLMIPEHIGVFEPLPVWVEILIFAVPYALIGYDILIKAAKNISHGQVFDENFLMIIATVAAFCIGEYSEAVAVMLFYQVGELFQSVAVGKARRSISDLMDIAPEYANIEQDGGLEQVDPDDVEPDSIIVVLSGERIPLDGVITEGETMLDTSALTGESAPRHASVGDEVISGCINGSGTIKVRTTKAYEDSTVARILELVENAGSKKAKTEKFITRFAKIYTPAVTIAALLLAVIPPLLFGGEWGEWIKRACIFLVISCPCALVISVPLGFFGGIGAASKAGILVKGGNYLEAVSEIKTVVFDKTGTLTKGEFKVSSIEPSGCTRDKLSELAAHVESFSTHPIAVSICEEYGKPINAGRVSEVEEIAGHGIKAVIDGSTVLLGNLALMRDNNIPAAAYSGSGTAVYTAENGEYRGVIIISDGIKEGSADAIRQLKEAGVERCVMLTGDRKAEADAISAQLGIDLHYSELLPADKVQKVEELLKDSTAGKLAFAGDGINDAPVLARADVGIAMGSMGSDAAIEAADIVIMDDDLRKIPAVMRIASRTMRIVRENIVFALAVKLAVMILGALGIANMWLAVFADVGVAVIAILNSMRALRSARSA